MRTHLTAWMLSSAVALAGGTLMAQTGGAGSTGNSMGGNTSPGVPSAIGSSSISSNAQTQIEGQLVDILSAAQGSGSSASSSMNPGGASSGSSSGMTSGSSSTPRPASGSTANVPPANMSGGNTMGEGATRSDVAPGRTGNTGNTSGGNTMGQGATRSDVAAGAGRTQTTGNVSGGNTLGNAGTGSSAAAGAGSSSSMTGAGSTGSNSSLNTGGTGSMNTGSSTSGTMSTDIRQQLNSGIPAAVVSGGQTYILAVDAKSLAAHAGETVRISGRAASNNIFIPERIEARQGNTGEFCEVAFIKPNTGNRTAGER